MNEVTILVVEDALDVRHMTVAMVKELGYLVLEASDAESALVEIESHPEIKVLLTDVVLPGLNGRQLAARACEMRPDLAVLFVTGYVKDHGRDEFDPDQLISKPFTLQTLAAKLRAAAGAVC